MTSRFPSLAPHATVRSHAAIPPNEVPAVDPSASLLILDLLHVPQPDKAGVALVAIPLVYLAIIVSLAHARA